MIPVRQTAPLAYFGDTADLAYPNMPRPVPTFQPARTGRLARGKPATMAVERAGVMRGAMLEDLAGQITRGIWSILSARADQAHLHAGYYVAIERTALESLTRHFTGGMVLLEGRRIMFWTDPRGANAFASRLTEDIVEVLSAPLCHSPALPLIAIEIPAAIHAAVAVYLADELTDPAG